MYWVSVCYQRVSPSPSFSFASILHSMRKLTNINATLDDFRIKIFLYVLLMDLEFSIDPSIEIEKKVKYAHSSYLMTSKTNSYILYMFTFSASSHVLVSSRNHTWVIKCPYTYVESTLPLVLVLWTSPIRIRLRICRYP